jgi:hypothetical protein
MTTSRWVQGAGAVVGRVMRPSPAEARHSILGSATLADCRTARNRRSEESYSGTTSEIKRPPAGGLIQERAQFCGFSAAGGWNSEGAAPPFSAPISCSTGGRVWAMPLWQSMQVLPSFKPVWCMLAER